MKRKIGTPSEQKFISLWEVVSSVVVDIICVVFFLQILFQSSAKTSKLSLMKISLLEGNNKLFIIKKLQFSWIPHICVFELPYLSLLKHFRFLQLTLIANLFGYQPLCKQIENINSHCWSENFLDTFCYLVKKQEIMFPLTHQKFTSLTSSVLSFVSISPISWIHTQTPNWWIINKFSQQIISKCWIISQLRFYICPF